MSRHPDNKITRVLSELAQGRALNRLEAIGLGDTTLNSTIAILRNRHGLTILDEWERYESKNGTTKLKRYWIPADGMEKATVLLAYMRSRSSCKRGG